MINEFVEAFGDVDFSKIEKDSMDLKIEYTKKDFKKLNTEIITGTIIKFINDMIGTDAGYLQDQIDILPMTRVLSIAGIEKLCGLLSEAFGIETQKILDFFNVFPTSTLKGLTNFIYETKYNESIS